MLYRNLPLALLHMVMYVSLLPSQFPPSHSLMRSANPFSLSVSLFLPRKWVLQSHFSRFHIYTLIYNIWFSLSDFTLYNRLPTNQLFFQFPPSFVCIVLCRGSVHLRRLSWFSDPAQKDMLDPRLQKIQVGGGVWAAAAVAGGVPSGDPARDPCLAVSRSTVLSTVCCLLPTQRISSGCCLSISENGILLATHTQNVDTICRLLLSLTRRALPGVHVVPIKTHPTHPSGRHDAIPGPHCISLSLLL